MYELNNVRNSLNYAPTLVIILLVFDAHFWEIQTLLFSRIKLLLLTDTFKLVENQRDYLFLGKTVF